MLAQCGVKDQRHHMMRADSRTKNEQKIKFQQIDAAFVVFCALIIQRYDTQELYTNSDL